MDEGASKPPQGMDDDIREDAHGDLAHCSREEFLEEYLKRDTRLQDIFDSEFGGKLR